jgi:hypothetical protein
MSSLGRASKCAAELRRHLAVFPDDAALYMGGFGLVEPNRAEQTLSRSSSSNRSIALPTVLCLFEDLD